MFEVGRFGLPFLLLSKEMQDAEIKWAKEAEEEKKRHFEEDLFPNAVDWDLKFTRNNPGYKNREVCFKASTYNVAQKHLFDIEPVLLTHKGTRGPLDTDVVSPVIKKSYRNARWVYRNVILSRGESLSLSFGNAKGKVYFDGDVSFPVLYMWTPNRYDSFDTWMSITPQEIVTQRSGISHCKGTVCIGGYGLGWFLEQVAKKRTVKKIVLVEKYEELFDWFGNEHIKHVIKETGTPIEIVIGDVFPYLKENHEKFDRIALDVFKSYGNNNLDDNHDVRDLLREPYKKHRYRTQPRFDASKLWCWGSVVIGQKERIRYI